jgi:hypothetical protein
MARTRPVSIMGTDKVVDHATFLKDRLNGNNMTILSYDLTSNEETESSLVKCFDDTTDSCEDESTAPLSLIQEEEEQAATELVNLTPCFMKKQENIAKNLPSTPYRNYPGDRRYNAKPDCLLPYHDYILNGPSVTYVHPYPVSFYEHDYEPVYADDEEEFPFYDVDLDIPRIDKKRKRKEMITKLTLENERLRKKLRGETKRTRRAVNRLRNQAISSNFECP